MKPDVREYSLVVFTVFAQLSVGAFWTLMATDLCLVSRYDIAHTAGISMAPLLMILVAMLASMFVAFTHLGSPSAAYKALANLRHSWLSRELLTANFFIGAAVAFAGAQWLEIGSTGMRAAVAWLTVLAGASLLYSMSRVYMLRTVPVWNTVYTPLSFFLTGLILGPLALGLVFTIASPGWLPADASAGAEVLPMLSVTALAFLGLQFLMLPARIASLLSGTPRERQAIGQLFEHHKKILLARLAAALLGAAGLLAMFAQSHYAAPSYFFAFAVILIAELLERYVFYAAREASRL